MITDAGSPMGTEAEMSSDLVNFAAFMRLSAPPTPAEMSASARNGANLFNSVGCALCHTSTLTTGMAKSAAMSNVTYHPFSDFAVHHMGARLSDGVHQGGAGPDQFRTAPLWGLGQRLFFLHDGRTADLLQAIQAHASNDCTSSTNRTRSSPPELRLGSQWCDPQIQFTQPFADAGYAEFPSLLVGCSARSDPGL